MSGAEITAWEYGRSLAANAPSFQLIPEAINASATVALAATRAAARVTLGEKAWCYWVARGAYEWETEHRPQR